MTESGPPTFSEPTYKKSWYTIRDYLTGENNNNQDIPKALELAKTCDHPDAVWLTRVTSAQTCVQLINDMKGQIPDRRATCFLAILQDFTPYSYHAQQVQYAADAGYPYAYTVLIEHVHTKNKKPWAQKAIDLDERNGYYHMGTILYYGSEKEERILSTSFFRKAARLGHYDAIQMLCGMTFCIESTYWLCQCISFKPDRNTINSLLSSINNALKYPDDQDWRMVLWYSANILRGHINVDKSTVFGFLLCACDDETHRMSNTKLIAKAIRCITICDIWISKTRQLMDISALVMRSHFRVPKDIRLLICKQLWQMQTSMW